MPEPSPGAARREYLWPTRQLPGPETEALKRFHRDMAWSGTVKASSMTPEMTATGRGTFRWTDDGLWVIGSFSQEQFYEGRQVASWRAQYLAGYDYSRRAYVAFAADSNGRAVPFTGSIDGDRFIITSDGATIAGAPVRLRMTWDCSSPETMTWRNDMSINNGPWQLVEEYDMRPLGQEAR
jgi:hypothetical protein